MKSNGADVSGYFLFFSAPGRGRGSPGRQRRTLGVVFLLKIPRRGPVSPAGGGRLLLGAID